MTKLFALLPINYVLTLLQTPPVCFEVIASLVIWADCVVKYQ